MPRKLARREKKIFEKLSLSKELPLTKLEKLYMFLDELNSYVGKFTPCKKGCSHCCYIKISISSLEGEYIESNLGIKRKMKLNIKNLFGTPCPFLDNNTCSIYQFRPFMCRRHHALTKNSTWCELDKCNKYEFPQIRFTKVEDSYNFLKSVSGSFEYDIRQLF